MRNISTFQCAADIADLYRQYLDYIARSQEEIESRTVPGTFRERLLANYRPLALEHFEARLDSLRAHPAEYAAAVQSLQRGFMPAE
jgi:hypothetical protein